MVSLFPDDVWVVMLPHQNVSKAVRVPFYGGGKLHRRRLVRGKLQFNTGGLRHLPSQVTVNLHEESTSLASGH
jgi:hypothetical protein